jgi:hypothetical protein
VKGYDAAVSGVFLYVVYDVIGSKPFGIIAGDNVPHDDTVFAIYPPIYGTPHKSMRGTEEMGMYQLVSLLGVGSVCDGHVLIRP